MMTAHTRPTRLLVVDDHKIVLIGLKTLFGALDRYAVDGEASTALDAVAEARRVQPDIVLMDVRLSDGSGIEACREIRSEFPNVRVVILTSYPDEEAVFAAIAAGAQGYLLKHTDPHQLIDAVDAVARGDSLIDPGVTGMILGWMRKVAEGPNDNPFASLSNQERQILPLIADGKSNREIGADLSLSESTVKTYVSHLLQKLHLVRRSQAAALLARERLAFSNLPASSVAQRRNDETSSFSRSSDVTRQAP